MEPSSSPQPTPQPPRGEHVADSPIYKKALGKAEDYLKKPLRVKQLLNDAYAKASKQKDIGQIAGEVWDSLQILFRMISAAVSGRYHGIPTRVLLGGTAVILYFMSPIDAIPDFIPVIGLLDDAALLAWFMTTIKDEMDRFHDWERTTGAEGADHHQLAAKPSADVSAEAHDHPTSEAAHDHSPRVLTTDATRVPSRGDSFGGDPGGNVR